VISYCEYSQDRTIHACTTYKITNNRFCNSKSTSLHWVLVSRNNWETVVKCSSIKEYRRSTWVITWIVLNSVTSVSLSCRYEWTWTRDFSSSLVSDNYSTKQVST